ncbi:MAG: hypothetical protein IPO62_03125 [Saprospiraceae bacterium]|nr:hypothetical protein [Saprospiraceae bacterium]MBK9630054.1 hypothetical protein [Saprospiraceae bacterium]
MMKKYILHFVFILVATINPADAEHQVGGYINYKVIPNINGTFTLEGSMHAMRDLNSTGAGIDEFINVGIYKKTAQGWVSVTSVYIFKTYSKTIQLPLEERICSNQNTVSAFEMGVYEFKNELPQINTEYMIAFQRCCRIESLINIENGGDGGTILCIILSPKGQKTAHEGPHINLKNLPLAYVGVDTTLNIFEQSSLNNDLKIEFTTPQHGGGKAGSAEGRPGGSSTDCDGVTPDPRNCLPPYTNVAFSAGYSYDQPLGNSGTVSLNLSSGDLTFHSDIIGNFLMGFILEVSNKIGESLSSSNLEFVTSFVNELNPVYEFTGFRFYDKNRNEILDSDETKFDFPIKLEGDHCYYRTHQDGKLEISGFPEKAIQISSESELWQISSATGSVYEIYSDKGNVQIDKDIPFIPKDEIVSAELFGFLSSTRCNEEARYVLELSNIGTSSLTGELQITLDSILKFRGMNFPFVFRDGKYIVNVNQLDPLVDRMSIVIKVLMPTEIFEGKPIRILNTFYSKDYSIDFLYENIVRCAYDPNQKTATPYNGLNNRLYGPQAIIYSIDFENLGNDPAFSVLLSDRIDDKLDLSSFEFLESSHPCKYYIKPNRELIFNFEQVNLPDSKTDSLGARGFARFKIKPIKNLNDFDLIYNSADIIFDNNSPITTNTTLNTFITYKNKKKSIEEIIHDMISKAIISPLPFNEEFQIEIPDYYLISTALTWKILNPFGQILKEGILRDKISKIEMAHFADGLYYLSVDVNGKRSHTKKLIKLRK